MDKYHIILHTNVTPCGKPLQKNFCACASYYAVYVSSPESGSPVPNTVGFNKADNVSNTAMSNQRARSPRYGHFITVPEASSVSDWFDFHHRTFNSPKYWSYILLSMLRPGTWIWITRTGNLFLLWSRFNHKHWRLSFWTELNWKYRVSHGRHFTLRSPTPDFVHGTSLHANCHKDHQCNFIHMT